AVLGDADLLLDLLDDGALVADPDVVAEARRAGGGRARGCRRTAGGAARVGGGARRGHGGRAQAEGGRGEDAHTRTLGRGRGRAGCAVAPGVERGGHASLLTPTGPPDDVSPLLPVSNRGTAGVGRTRRSRRGSAA